MINSAHYENDSSEQKAYLYSSSDSGGGEGCGQSPQNINAGSSDDTNTSLIEFEDNLAIGNVSFVATLIINIKSLILPTGALHS